MRSTQFKKGHRPWNKNPIRKKCLTCNRKFEVSLSRSNDGRGKFCSRTCKTDYKYKIADNFIIDTSMAELIGIIIGDGCINKVYKREDYRIQISGNKIEDKEYMDNYLRKLVNKCLGINPKPYLGKNGAYILQFQSEPFRIFLHGLGIKSPKTTIRIPKEIRNDERLLRACIRGIADSDFTFLCTKKRKKSKNNYPRISAHFVSRPLVKDLENSLRKMGFTLNCKYDYRRMDPRGFATITNYINIDGPHNFKRWMKKIGFSNMRIITRFRVWKKYGELKPKTSIEERKRLLLG